jgi:hypothetical protein
METNRRNFLKLSGAALASIPFLSFPHSAQANTALVPAKESDAMPKSLKYCLDADKPSKQCDVRKAKDKKDQYCRNCQLYTKLSGEGKAEIGKCMLMPKNSVPAQAWCMSWVKKP